MLILFHILIALSSLAYTTFTFISPSCSRLQMSYVLALSTLLTGGYLVFLNPAHFTQTCLTGIVYVAVTLYGTNAARRTLLKASSN